MNIKVLGPGCKRCVETEKIVKEAVAQAGIDAVVEHVSNIGEIAKYEIFATPAVVIDEEIKSVGKIPTKDEVMAWLK